MNESVYANPVLRGFFPDPSVVRVGEDFYMVNSSFQYWPAIPVSHSRDLVNWKIIGHGVTDPGALDLGDLADSHGIWAADISWHDGKFWIYATLRLNNPLEGQISPLRCQIVVHAEKPEGPWSKPVFIDVDNIDPSHFVDDDGKRYMLISPGINLYELAPDGLSVQGEGRQIWPGTGRRCPEGPHLLKKDGWYYVYLAEGGTGFGHCVTMARSRNLLGPYEECPHNPLLTQDDPAGAIQRTGHAKFVQTAQGDWWAVYLCGRNNNGPYTTLGRETALDPVTWDSDGWPHINQGRGPSTVQEKPGLRGQDLPLLYRDDFTAPVIGPDWLFLRRPQAEFYSLSERPGYLRLMTGSHSLECIHAENLLLQREREHSYRAVCALDFQPGKRGPRAGLVNYYGIRNHILLFVAWDGEFFVQLIENRNGQKRDLGQRRVSSASGLQLKTEVRGQYRQFFCMSPGEDWMLVGTVQDASFLSDEGVLEGKHHTGTLVGLFAWDGGSGMRVVADFDWFQHDVL